MTQTVPDISPLMPMHQDPLLVPYRLYILKYEHGHFTNNIFKSILWMEILKMAMRHFGPFTEPPTASHTCWDIPPNLTYGHWYPKYITFSVKSTKFCIFHFWGCVSPHLWQAPLPLAPRLVVTLQSLITPNHIWHSWWCHSKIRSELMWCWYHMFTIWQICVHI